MFKGRRLPSVGFRLVLVACLVLAVVTSAAAGVRQAFPEPLTHPVTLRCDPPLVTAVDEIVPRPLIVIRAVRATKPLGVLVRTNGVTQYAWMDAQGFLGGEKPVCAKSVLPKALPRASLVRLKNLSLVCVVPGRRLLVHAERRDGTNLMTLRALPHGQLLLHVQLVGKTMRAYASRYAARLCELDA